MQILSRGESALDGIRSQYLDSWVIVKKEGSTMEIMWITTDIVLVIQ